MLIRGFDRVHIEFAELRDLVEVAFSGVPTDGVEVHVHPARHSGESFSGRAYPGRPRRARLHPATRYLVVLVLPRHFRNRAYPRTHTYRGLKTAPPITVADWRERLVALAAHEACHIRQFREGLRRSEVDAERWALRVLHRYRQDRENRERPAPSLRNPRPQERVGPIQLSLFTNTSTRPAARS